MTLQCIALTIAVCGLCLTPSVAKNNASDALKEFSRQMPVRGIVRSSHQADIATDLSARITKVGFKEGEHFFKHDLLIALDCKRLEAEWESAKAMQREMELALKSAQYLKRQQAGSDYKVETAIARLDRAKAEAKAINSRVDQCEIRAPFAGRVAKLGIHEHEMPTAGRPIISILSNEDPTLELIVPSNWLMWLKVGMPFQFTIDETNSSHKSEVARIGASVDSVSQTVKIYARLIDIAPNILPGMSGTAQFEWDVGAK